MQDTNQNWIRSVIWIVVVLSMVSCQRGPAVVIRTASGSAIEVPVEIARTDEQRARGLMYRTDLPEDGGMLFVFPESRRLSFWMKNTPLSLDMIFITSDNRIAGIVKRAVPFSAAPVGVEDDSRFVLEVHGGFCDRRGIHPGDLVEFKGI